MCAAIIVVFGKNMCTHTNKLRAFVRDIFEEQRNSRDTFVYIELRMQQNTTEKGKGEEK